MQVRQGVSTMQQTRSNTSIVVAAHGEIDIDTAPRLQHALAGALKAHYEVVLDLSQVTFMDCSGLRVLDRALRLADEHHSRLVLRGAAASVRRLLKVTGMHRHLTLEP
jgi:anti-anti-sigma factor